MEKSLKIGSSSDLLSYNEAKQLISGNTGFEYVRIRKNASLDSIKQELFAKEYDLVCVPLSKLPFVLPDGIVLAGVSKRYDTTLSFIGNQNCLKGPTIRDIREGSKILVQSEIIKLQLQKLLPEVDCQIDTGNFVDTTELLKSNKIAGFIRPNYEFEQNKFSLDDHYVWNFSPYEMIGVPADGVITYVCRMDDIIVRKFIKNIHESDTSKCTNVERKIMKSFDSGTIGAYCFKDEHNNFQIHAVNNIEGNERCFFTQSTSAGLAEKIIEILSNEANLSTI